MEEEKYLTSYNKKLERNNIFHKVYLNIALNVAELSRAKRKKVGCVIVDKDNNIISYGYNGTPSGSDNNCEHCHEDGTMTTKNEVLHAESNAITKVAKSTNSSNNCKIYLTLSPCFECSKLIIQSGITHVYYIEEYRDITGIDLLFECGIVVKQIKI